jgi:hypothetical protein
MYSFFIYLFTLLLIFFNVAYVGAFFNIDEVGMSESNPFFTWWLLQATYFTLPTVLGVRTVPPTYDVLTYNVLTAFLL